MNKILTMPSLWAILPDEINTIQRAYLAYLQGDNDKAHGIARPHAPLPVSGIFDVDLDRVPETFFMSGEIGVLPIEGVITPKSDIFSFLFGGSTLDVMTRDLKTLVNDDAVKAIVLDIDSPGGVAFGVEQFANLVFEARAIKPIISISSTMMASAAMWIGAAAEQVFITGEVVMTGSIGTVINHIDISELEKMFGIKTTEITAGKFKRIASSVKPLSEEGRAELQSQVDHVNSAFVADIARFRGVSPETVNTDMADGKTFLGSQAVEAGLIDGVISADDFIEHINAVMGNTAGNINTFNGGNIVTVMTKKDKPEVITADSIREDHSGVYAQIFTLGKQEGTDDLNQAVADAFEDGRKHGAVEGEIMGAKTELDRIRSVETQLVPGNEELITKLKYDGITTGPEAAVEVIKAEKTKMADGLNALKTNSPDPVPGSAEEDNREGGNNSDPLKSAWDKGPQSEALKKEFGGDYDSFKSYYENEEQFKATGEIKL